MQAGAVAFWLLDPSGGPVRKALVFPALNQCHEVVLLRQGKEVTLEEVSCILHFSSAALTEILALP